MKFLCRTLMNEPIEDLLATFAQHKPYLQNLYNEQITTLVRYPSLCIYFVVASTIFNYYKYTLYTFVINIHPISISETQLSAKRFKRANRIRHHHTASIRKDDRIPRGKLGGQQRRTVQCKYHLQLIFIFKIINDKLRKREYAFETKKN
jgi:hypothetical protein